MKNNNHKTKGKMIDYIAGALELLGLWKVGNKNKWGFIISIFAKLLWIAVAFTTKVYGILVIAVPSLIVCLRGFYKWNKEDNVQSHANRKVYI